MVRLVTFIGCLAGALAMPGDDEIADEIEAYLNGTAQVGACNLPECNKPSKKYEQIMNTQPGYQWNDAGGYCGSFATQRAAMAKGAWISQQQVRDHTKSGGGNDNEILDTNIDLAWQNLKLKYESFDFRHEATPHVDKIRKFMKKQMSAGNVVVMMIQKAGHRFPIYGMKEPSGFYDHVVPFTGIMSDHPLTDEQFYDDDYIVHYTDHSVYPYYRSMESLVGAYNGKSSCPSTSGDAQYVCLHPKYGFGWALQGFQDSKDGLPLSLTVDPWEQEPDTRRGSKATQLTGTLHIEGLSAGKKYAVYRWDSVSAAFDYSNPTSVHRFTASGSTEKYTDSKTFISSGTTYYRCIVDSSDVVV
jgi:hypothetical protein